VAAGSEAGPLPPELDDEPELPLPEETAELLDVLDVLDVPVVDGVVGVVVVAAGLAPPTRLGAVPTVCVELAPGCGAAFAGADGFGCDVGATTTFGAVCATTTCSAGCELSCVASGHCVPEPTDDSIGTSARYSSASATASVLAAIHVLELVMPFALLVLTP
jgi:hypothetical protein